MDLHLHRLALLLLWICSFLPDLLGFNFDTKKLKVFPGSAEARFGSTVQQHQAGGRQWLLVGAPFQTTGKTRTGDVFRCPLDNRTSAGCSRLHLGRLSLDNVSGRRDEMRLGLTLTSDPRDSSFLTCGPLWSHECGSSLYSTGICSRVSRTFRPTSTITPALQRCETFMDIVIVLDGSNSIYPWSEVQDFLINILHKFYMGPGQTQVGVVQYGSSVVHEFGLGEHQTVEEVVAAARRIIQRGGEETRTALAIDVARAEAFRRGGRPGAQKVMIVITDGESHDSRQLPRAVAASEGDNVTMYAVAVLGYYNRRGIDPEGFLREIRLIASDPDETHAFNVTDEAALKDIVDALGERIFPLEGTSSRGRGFGLHMAQAGFSSHLIKDGVLLGAVGAYDWTGAVLKDTKHGRVVPPRSSYEEEFPEELKNHGAYLGYSVGSLVTSDGSQLYTAGAPRFNHSGKVIVFTLEDSGGLRVLKALLGEQIGSYFGSQLLSLDVDADGQSDVLLVAAPMYCTQGWETGKVYVYGVTPEAELVLQGALEASPSPQNARLGSSLAEIEDMDGDGFRELAVGAPLEDDHQGAVYLFYGRGGTIRRRYRQRVAAAGFSAGLSYFGQSLHGVLDVNGDGLVDLAVGALGAAVLIWSRGVVQIHTRLVFQPEKVNVFNKDCLRGGVDVSCMSLSVCLSLSATTRRPAAAHVGVWYLLVLDSRVVLDDPDQQSRTLLLQTGTQSCHHHGFSVQEASDQGRPISVVVETGLQHLDEGPVLDPDQPRVLRAELPFWNGCVQEDACVPDLVLQGRTDLLDLGQFCSSRSGWSLCGHRGAPEGGAGVVEAGRRKVLVLARLENRGENAYGTTVRISTSSNLLFSSLMLKDQWDVEMECSSANELSCNVSAPFMKPWSQVSFHLEFQLRREPLLDHVEVVMTTSSEGEDRNGEDNHRNIHLPLRYQAELLFTRDPNPPRFQIRAGGSAPFSSPGDGSDGSAPDFSLTYQIQNLGSFSVHGVLFRAEIWAVTRRGNHLVRVLDVGLEQVEDKLQKRRTPDASSSVLLRPQVSGSRCQRPPHPAANQIAAEDLSHLSQLNSSNGASVAAECRLHLPASGELKVTLRGRLQLPALLAVSFRSLEVLTTASVQMEPSSPMFLQEDVAVREIILEIRKEEDRINLVWIILGSSLGGLLLLALLVLALWKVGFFNQRRSEEEEEEQPVANGKAAAELS